MKDIKCVDLTSYNCEKLKEVSEFLGIQNHEAMVENKKNGVTKMWIDISNNMTTIAYSVKGDKNVYMTDEFLSDLNKIKPFVLIKKVKELNLNSILDKISEYGITSLSTNEKLFLDNQ